LAKDDDVSIFDELDSRLDDFFADDDDLFSEDDDLFSEDDNDPAVNSVDDDEPVADSANVEINQLSVPDPEKMDKVDNEAPLNRLKAIVLEMDWEISDENLNKYLSEIQRLIEFYENDRPIYLFFKLHATIGKYMLLKKAQAHPDALKFLYSVYNSLEKAIIDGLPLLDKNKLILHEVNHFKNLKNKLFPDFSAKTESKKEENDVDKNQVDVKIDSAVPEDNTIKENGFDISALSDDMQKGISEYIEKSIASKLDDIKKELKSN